MSDHGEREGEVKGEQAKPRRIVLAIASGGGHWIQLHRLSEAFAGHRVVWVASDPSLEEDVPGHEFHTVQDASREEPLLVFKLLFQVARLVLRVRPDVVISTGAAPGMLGVLFGKLAGAQTIWVDSVANAEQLSLSGRLVRPFADLWMTQWEHLAGEGGPRYEGSVL